MADLLTDDMDIRDTKLSMLVGGNGDYYLSLKETKRGKIIKLDTRIAMSGGNATTEVKTAIANLYKALQGEQISSVLKANENIPLVINCPLCGAETLYTDPERCTTIDCPNCIF